MIPTWKIMFRAQKLSNLENCMAQKPSNVANKFYGQKMY